MVFPVVVLFADLLGMFLDLLDFTETVNIKNDKSFSLSSKRHKKVEKQNPIGNDSYRVSKQRAESTPIFFATTQPAALSIISLPSSSQNSTKIMI